MFEKQRTIKRGISLEGVGLHTGNPTKITFYPAPPDSGVRFIRADLPDKPAVTADIEHVVDISRGTTLANGDARVCTVEHVLAAISGMQIDNLNIELMSNEPPVGDGSAKPFVDKILEAGIETQDADRQYLEIDSTLSYSEPDRAVDIVVTPSDTFRITFLIDYKNPALGTQYTTLVDLEKEFVEEFAPARTFCFLSEIEMLRDQDLIKGGGIHNAVVIYDSDKGQIEVDRIRKALNLKDEAFVGKTGIINDIPLRFYNEPVRHKALDLIGDLFLLGVPIKGHILAARSGHKANVALVKKLQSLYRKKKLASKFQKISSEPFLDINGIMNIMPHRYPFLLIDKVLELEPLKRVTAIKNVSYNEPFFQGHFPGYPVMPGVLIIEAMAQAGGVLLLEAVEEPQKKLVFFLSMDKVKFRRQVLPGDTLRFELEMLMYRRGTCKMRGKTYVGDTLVAEAELMAVVKDK
jgi:UDP-3-O-[3-hydroxymyristoyl] N-acetylglucosamine deacetylase/3-hydroxyacyl-[acyl-carrier-protein] dehydratase